MSDNALHRAIASITVGTRHRRDLGDLEPLAESIRRLGPLQPITVTPDGVLICGHRRLEAARQLGWTTIPVHVRSGISTHLAALLAEREENTQRKPLNPVEESELYDEILTVEREEAARRQEATRFHPGHHNPARPGEHDASEREGETGNSGSGNLPGPERPGDARHKAAVLVTGKAAYKRLERTSALRAIADDDTATPVARELAALAVEDIQAGAPVFPTYDQAMTQIAALDPTRPAIRPVTADDLADTARQAIDRVTTKATTKNPKKGTGTGTTAPTGQSFGRALHAWVELWHDVSGQNVDDPTAIATSASDKDWNHFEHLVDTINTFRDTGRAARAARTTEPVAIGSLHPRRAVPK
ncbi:ParB N-terminal domain-containing protein [Antribacter sp. KLBMP9083]|uniref:ParB N-terminal domain-containing protein n=1 Tax=Antribacter soli TaxID=2910976 RepID=A0AA41QE07_9MICO|nr:ParB N-terminal domain-containing protein [Antribacter soli]MCF4121735.1 ParB N-terminal domain-containing protein [Antribacter soli]